MAEEKLSERSVWTLGIMFLQLKYFVDSYLKGNAFLNGNTQPRVTDCATQIEEAGLDSGSIRAEDHQS